MNDRDFLIWLRERMINHYHESPYVDFVHKLTAIINATPADRLTPNLCEPLCKLPDWERSAANRQEARKARKARNARSGYER
jgi:hypothetical protein